MNKGELIQLQELRNNGKIISRKSKKIYYNNKQYIKTIIEYNYFNNLTKENTLFKSCKIGRNKKHSIIKCYNDLLNKKELIRLYNFGFLVIKDESPSYPDTSQEELD
jgi:hypothetical protein